MSMLPLTERTIIQYASEESLARERQYYQQGVVLSLVKRGMTLWGSVQDKELQPYIVRCTVESKDAITAICTCSYNESDWCKHIIATCLAAIHQPEKIEERPSIEVLLSDLDREYLQKILMKLIEREPAIAEIIEMEALDGQLVSLGLNSSESEAKPSSQATEVNAKAVRRQVGSIMHSLDHMRPSEA